MISYWLRAAHFAGLVERDEDVGTAAWAGRALRFMCYLAILALLLSSCGPVPGPTPTPTPTVAPTPTPTPEPTYSHLRLVIDGAKFVFANGQPFECRKVVFCCKDTEGTGWPGLSDSAIDHAYYQGRATLLHWRVGPFRACNEPEWAVTGGGAYAEVDGLADLSRWNEPYWQALRSGVKRAGDLGIVVEVSLTDGWSIKTKEWASGLGPACWHPWHPAGNVQHQDHLTTAWKGLLDQVQTEYVLKIFDTVGDLQNVIFEDGTEPDQIPGSSVTWSLTMEALLRQREAANVWPAHLFGTNFDSPDAIAAWFRKGRLQYLNLHKTQPLADSWWTPDPKHPLVVDEYNPEPPYHPNVIHAFYSYAYGHGTYWAAWRHDQAVNWWNASLSLIAAGPSQDTDGCPYEVPPVDKISCRKYSGSLHDCTPSAYGRPIRPEGDPTRSLCEAVAAGGVPTYTLINASGNLSLSLRPNPYQFVVNGNGTATLRCTVPARPGVDLCGGFVVRMP